MEIDIVIPVYNEEELLLTAIERFIFDLKYKIGTEGISFKILIVENGSTDNSFNICKELSKKFEELRIIKIEDKNYGKALKQGILNSNGDYILALDIDLCDIEFVTASINLLKTEIDRRSRKTFL